MKLLRPFVRVGHGVTHAVKFIARRAQIVIMLEKFHLDAQAVQEGKKPMTMTLVFDVLQILGVAAGLYSTQAQAFMGHHQTVAGVAVAVLAALNRLLPSWFAQAKLK